MRMERTGRFARLYQGCRVLGCDRPHRSKGFCRGHLSAFERGRLDSSGSPVPNRCELCSARYVARRGDRRFCPECVKRRARERVQQCRKARCPASKGETGAHTLIRSLWDLRGRLQKMNDAELLAFSRTARYMLSPRANFGRPPRQSFVIQLEEARAEWRRRRSVGPRA